jgi:hypothetical protein
VPKEQPRAVTPKAPLNRPPRAVPPRRHLKQVQVVEPRERPRAVTPRDSPKHRRPRVVAPRRLSRVAAPKHHLPRVAMHKRPPRVAAAPKEQDRTSRLQNQLSKPIRTSPKRYSGPVLTGICRRCMTFTRRFHPLEVGSGASAVTLSFLARGMRTNCRWIFLSVPITFLGRETTLW